jgi:hypothetical protein
MRHFGLIIHHVCEQLVNGEAKGDCPPWWYPLSRVVRVRLTNLIRTHSLEKATYPKQNTSVYVWRSNPGTNPNLGESFD